MKKRIEITETSTGVVVIDVPKDATEDQIWSLAEQAYFDGKTVWMNGDWEIGKIYDA